MPIPLKIATDAQRSRIRELKIDSFVLGPQPAAVFAAEASGLPRAAATPEAIDSDAVGRGWLWIGLGGLLLVVGLWLRFRPRRARTPVQSS